MNPEVLATVCFYATDIHKGALGRGMKDDTLARMKEIKGENLMIWGRQDPHIPQEGRQIVYQAMASANLDFQWHEFNGAHAFIRDEGARYNPSLAILCYGLAFELFKRKLTVG
jgi:carboxymethylenebutenolidase